MNSRPIKASINKVSLFRTEWSLPRSASSYNAIVEQMAKSMFIWETKPGWTPAKWEDATDHMKLYYLGMAQAALKGVGIKKPKA